MKYTKLFPVMIGDMEYTDKEVQNSEELQLKAIEEDEYAIEYINNPSNEIQIEAVKENPFAIQHT